MLVQKSIEKYYFLNFTESILEGIRVATPLGAIYHLDLRHWVLAVLSKRPDVPLKLVFLNRFILVEQRHNEDWHKDHEDGNEHCDENTSVEHELIDSKFVDDP